jgi:hypothetical protein
MGEMMKLKGRSCSKYKRDGHKILAGKSEWKLLRGRHRHRREDNIKSSFKYIRCQGVG